MKKYIKIGIYIFIIILAIITTSIFYILHYYSGENLPNYKELLNYSPPLTTRLYSQDGVLIEEYAIENRLFVPIKKIPKKVINAFISAEDRNFYKHSGIDFAAIIRAAFLNAKSGEIKSGGSTITQQVVKNFLLTKEKTFDRKIKEAILSFRVSHFLSKEKVLELYLNQIYLGSGAYGVAAASLEYFNKSLNEISIEEAALLATLPKAPAKLDPRKNISAAKTRRDWVLNRMKEEGFISDQDVVNLKEKPIILVDKSSITKAETGSFADYVKHDLSQKFGSDAVFTSGMSVATSIISEYQNLGRRVLDNGIIAYDVKHGYRGAIGNLTLNDNLALEALRNFKIEKYYNSNWKKSVIMEISDKDYAKILTEDGKNSVIKLSNLKWARKYLSENATGPTPKKITEVFKLGDVILAEEVNGQYFLRQIPEINGALIAMNPNNGKILAMVGGFGDQKNNFNRVIQAKRQPGSLLKPFVYLAAMENGYNPASIIMDEEILLDQGDGLPPYIPQNYSREYYGPTTLRNALENSRNVVTVRLANDLGLDKVVEIVTRFGINKNPQALYSMVLGSLETTLLDMARAYSIIANGGYEIQPISIEKIQDKNGKVIYKNENIKCVNCNVSEFHDTNSLLFPEIIEESKLITDSASAYQIVSILEGVVRNGTAASAVSLGKIIAGKTGTTNDAKDAWFIGFTQDLLVGIYIGFDNPKPLGRSETGASSALPIFIDFMKEALKEKPSKPFKIPEGIKFVKIDKNTGYYPSANSRRVIFEAFKDSDKITNFSNDNQDISSDSQGLIY